METISKYPEITDPYWLKASIAKAKEELSILRQQKELSDLNEEIFKLKRALAQKV